MHRIATSSLNGGRSSPARRQNGSRIRRPPHDLPRQSIHPSGSSCTPRTFRCGLHGHSRIASVPATLCSRRLCMDTRSCDSICQWNGTLGSDSIESICGCCDSLFVLMLDGWRESRGVQAEIDLAIDMDLPVRLLVAVDDFESVGRRHQHQRATVIPGDVDLMPAVVCLPRNSKHRPRSRSGRERSDGDRRSSRAGGCGRQCAEVWSWSCLRESGPAGSSSSRRWPYTR